MRMLLKLVAAIAAVVSTAHVSVAHAQAYPAKPIRLIVPFPPGGGVDVMARLVMPLVAARIPGLRHVVTNRAGAAGQIGLEAAFDAAPDGYTLGATTIPAHNAIPLERPVRYRPMDFTFLANIVEDANCFYVRADSPIRSVPDLIAAARARPGQMNFGTTATLLSLIRQGKLRPLAVTNNTRLPELPDTPMMKAAFPTSRCDTGWRCGRRHGRPRRYGRQRRHGHQRRHGRPRRHRQGSGARQDQPFPAYHRKKG